MIMIHKTTEFHLVFRKNSSCSLGVPNISQHLRYGGGRRGRKRGGFQHNMNLTLQRAVHGLSDMASLLTKDPVVLTRAAEGAPQAG